MRNLSATTPVLLRSDIMMQRQNHNRKTESDRFIAVGRPAEADGVARALQTAFRDGYELPAEFQQCLMELNRIRF